MTGTLIRGTPPIHDKTQVSATPVEATARGNAVNVAVEPIVGWLVCTAGPDQGKDFRIVTGWNMIGRDESMSICIPSDEEISRSEHAKILFEPKKREFYLAPGDGRFPFYLNGDVVLQPTSLKVHDVVELGSTHLRFVPFCGSDFGWG